MATVERSTVESVNEEFSLYVALTIQGHAMDLFLKISVLQANFCSLGGFGKNNMSLERK